MEGFPGGTVIKNLPAQAGDVGSIPGLERSPGLEKEMATHSSILAWRVPWTEEPGESHGQRSLVGCSPWGHKRAGHSLATQQQLYNKVLNSS